MRNEIVENAAIVMTDIKKHQTYADIKIDDIMLEALLLLRSTLNKNSWTKENC